MIEIESILTKSTITTRDRTLPESTLITRDIYLTKNFCCEHCNQPYTEESLHLSVFTYGIYYLASDDICYSGVICSNCLKTIVFVGEKFWLDRMYDNLATSSLLIPYIGKTSVRFKYFNSGNSKFFAKNYPQLSKYIQVKQAILVNCDINEHAKKYPFFSNENCRTYVYESLPQPEEVVAFWQFSKDDIPELISYENDKSVRIFPRYVVADPLYLKIERLCWMHPFALDNIGKKTSLISRVSMADFHITGHKILRMYRGPKGLLTISSKRTIKENYDFIDLLDTIASQEHSSVTPIAHQINHSPLIRLIGKDSSHEDINNEKMIESIWNNFNAPHIQELLSKLIINFIDEFFTLSKKIDFSFFDIWELKNKYTKKIYQSIKSPSFRRTLAKSMSKHELDRVKKIEEQFPAFKKIISNNHKINIFKIQLPKIAQIKDLDILLLGESGTGKELFARAIHQASNRSGEFVDFNCAGVPETLAETIFFGHKKGYFTDAKYDAAGLFEKAHNGTLFLDEVGELSLNIQAILLRVIVNKEVCPLGGKSKKINVKIIYATNRDLHSMVSNKEFRLDLHKRIKTFEVHLPALRERKEDIPLLFRYLLDKHDKRMTKNANLKPISISPDAVKVISNCKYDGNVRDLENVCKKIAALRLIEENREEISDREILMELQDYQVVNQNVLPQKKFKPADKKRKLLTKEDMKALLKECNGNKSEAARRIGMSREHFTKETIKMGITKETIKMWL